MYATIASISGSLKTYFFDVILSFDGFSTFASISAVFVNHLRISAAENLLPTPSIGYCFVSRPPLPPMV